MIIGIGGASTSGKSLLASRIKTGYPNKKVKVLCQDDFVFKEVKLPRINNHIDWEVPESIDFERYREAILRCNFGYDIVIAEGLMVFYNMRIVQLFDLKIFIDIDKDTFFKRKANDLRWGKEPDWYIEHIWNSYLKYGKIPDAGEDYLKINGNISIDYGKVIKYISGIEK